MLFWEKKRHSKAYKDCAWHISSFIVAKVFGCNDLKPEKPSGPQTALKFMCCRYSFWQRLPRNNGCAKPTPFCWEFCQTFIKLWWQNGRRLTD
ncbi:hypothetical protein CBE85_02230 [Acinetobacter baumannii]|uniref:Uncharacterized protein n=1 Tax=Acinetobacter baumannii TaxID=470 RepID=A0A854NE76_ACIBA|nr:hypothetical protein CBE85_02230 [Acinetobacter baumannii]